MRENKIIEGKIVLELDSNVYSREVIFKCLYWYSATFRVNVELVEGLTFEVALRPLPVISMEIDDLENYLYRIERDLVDYNLREIVDSETRNIRDLIVAKAFSNHDEELPPPGEISDPVGFNPESSEK